MKIRMATMTLLLLATASVGLAQTDEAKTFDRLKGLAGTWHGTMKTTPKMPQADGRATTVQLRVTSMGNALMHEMQGEGRPDDPITMLYVDDGRLMLTHFCDAGNRPRMTGATTDDGKSVRYEFLDLTGSNEYGHMQRAFFQFVDADHHVEEWTYLAPDGTPVVARVELTRVGSAPKPQPPAAAHHH